ncbi:hypothetical protein [Gephyromycinifex aptenodytis]|uniref:hypothetical protein n=1 Tax=Gephyromycinifex aptenodytis TaxID=2716227 RepID=UPI001444B15E|nr:hypothetical protein [Gephyromycinifex aptenodytis]
MPTGENSADIVLTPTVLQEWALPNLDDGMDARGRVLIVGGHPHTPGAVLLAAEAAMRAGKLQLVVPQSLAVPMAMAMAMPEAVQQDRGQPVGPEEQQLWE